MSRYDWMDHAACVDYKPDTWFPETTGPGQDQAAVTVCSSCPVSAQCDQFAKSTWVAFGVWGGQKVRTTGAMGVSFGGPTKGKKANA